MTDFIHLRIHSAYSLSEGALPVKDLVKMAKQAQMPAMAITDRNNLFGALEFSQTMAGEGLQPLTGLSHQGSSWRDYPVFPTAYSI